MNFFRSMSDRFKDVDRPLILFCAAWVLFHVLTNGQYGFHRDELDTLDNARELAWGYVAYPPLTPFLARIGLDLFGPSLLGVRFFAALSQGIVALLTGLMVRDMGGNRLAQITAAFAVVISPVALTAGLLLHYLAFDYLWWVVTAYYVVRLIHTQDRRWWLGIGAAIGLGMMTKFTMAFFIVGIIAAVLLSPLRRDFRSRWLWLGVALALVIYLPNFIWQIQHDFVSLEFLRALHTRDMAMGRTGSFMVEQLYNCVNPAALPLVIAGLYAVFISRTYRPYRVLGWMFLVPLILFYLFDGRAYYIAPAYPMVIAAGTAWGAAWLVQRPPGLRRVLSTAMWVGLVVFAVVAVLLTLPVADVNSPLWETANRMGDNFREMIGWPELVETVAQVYNDMPEDIRPRTAILTGNYGETGAVNLYGPAHGLPAAISGIDSAWYRGYGETPPAATIILGYNRSQVSSLFEDCTTAARVTNAYGIVNIETSRAPTILVCGEARQTWDQLWPQLRKFQ